MKKSSELEEKFYAVKKGDKSFVVIPSEPERRFLKFVRASNKECGTVDEMRHREEYFSSLSIKEIAEIRVLTNEIKVAYEECNASKQPNLQIVPTERG